MAGWPCGTWLLFYLCCYVTATWKKTTTNKQGTSHRRAIERLGGNYGTCDDGSVFNKMYKLSYSRRACQQICGIRKVMTDCLCFDNGAEEFARKLNDSLRPCRSKWETNCMKNLKKTFDTTVDACSCNNPCSEVTYTRSASQRQWPSDEYAMVLVDSVCENSKQACRDIRSKLDDPRNVASGRRGISGNRAINNNFLKLNIYYEDLNFENITENPEIEVQQFLSDVGGAIGLWIGLSMLSLCELIQLFTELCSFAAHKTCREQRLERKARQKRQHTEEEVNRRRDDRVFSDISPSHFGNHKNGDAFSDRYSDRTYPHGDKYSYVEDGPRRYARSHYDYPRESY